MNKKLITQILIFGSIWGILEATIGHVLHWLPALIAGSIMFPIASVILIKAYQVTQNRKAIMYIAFVAGAIKSVDFLLPQITVFKVINPIFSIILEALVVVGVVTLLDNNKVSKLATGALISSIGWRTVFVSYMLLQGALTNNVAPYISSGSAIASFVLLEGVIGGALVILFMTLEQRFIKEKVVRFELKPIYGMALLLFAMTLQFYL